MSLQSVKPIDFKVKKFTVCDNAANKAEQCQFDEGLKPMWIALQFSMKSVVA